MKIAIIRHGKVNMRWRRWSTSEEFDLDCCHYEKSPLCLVNKKAEGHKADVIYISGQKRSEETAKGLFGTRAFIKTDLINEVPLRSSFDSKLKLPLMFWNLTGRMQWYLQSERQLESRKETEQRADKMIRQLVEAKKDCVLISHGFYMHIFIKRLKKQGFKIDKRKFGFSNLEEIVASR